MAGAAGLLNFKERGERREWTASIENLAALSNFAQYQVPFDISKRVFDAI